jgi:hypothetical protein
MARYFDGVDDAIVLNHSSVLEPQVGSHTHQRNCS